MDIAWFRAVAEEAVRSQDVAREDYVEFLKGVNDSEIREWAKGFYDECFGPMPEIVGPVPESVLNWFTQQAKKGVGDRPGPAGFAKKAGAGPLCFRVHAFTLPLQ
jgi:hypothetical protein